MRRAAPLRVRRPQVWEFCEQIAVRANFISRHFPIGEDREENVDNVVGERPAVVRKGCRPGCEAPPDPTPPVPTAPPPTCDDVIGGLSNSQAIITERLMNENSFNGVDVANIYTEDLWIMSAIYNRVAINGFNRPRNSSGQPVADTITNQALYANGPGRPTSITRGITLYNNSLTSAVGSALCDDLTDAVNAMDNVLANGPVNSKVLSWFGVFGGKHPPSNYPAPINQINNTQFFPFFKYPVVKRHRPQ